MTEKGIAEIYQMRILLEAACARRAVEALDEEDAKDLIRLSEEVDLTADDPEAGALARRNFYGEFYTKADLPRIRATVLQLRALVHRYHLLTDSGEHPNAHQELRDCIRDRDAEKAADVVRAHLETTRDDLIESLRAGRWSPV